MREITYRARDIGYGVEEGVARGEWCERDWTGKRRLAVARGEDLYLFDDEIVDDVEVEDERGPEDVREATDAMAGRPGSTTRRPGT